MSKVLSKGVAAYVAIGTTTTFTELCTMDISGGGVEASLVELEACLNEDTIEQITDLPKLLPIDITYKKQVASGGGNISTNLEAAVAAGTTVKLNVKYPLSTAVYGKIDCKAVSHNNDATSRPNHLTCSLQLIPIGAWTYNTTAPSV